MTSSIGKKSLTPAVCEPNRSYLRAELLERKQSLESHTLTVCHEGEAKDVFAIGVGEAGVGKKEWGDGKTPLGTFELGKPRKSHSGFSEFIEIRWADPSGKGALAQNAKPVGLHGPPESYNGLGNRDLTAGCLMTEWIHDIQEVANAVLRYNIQEIEISLVSHSVDETKKAD